MKVNAVFQGGGVKGIALVGAIAAMEERKVGFHQMAGTSSGSIVAALLAAGYTAEEMKKLILETPFSQFVQKDFLFRLGYAGPALRLLIKKGLYSGEQLERWVHRKLMDKGIRTFNDLQPRQLRIIASDITQGRLLVLPDDIIQYDINPDRFEISKAVRMSCSIPYFFEPVLIRKNVRDKKPLDAFHKQFYYIVDGGLLSNFPLWLFDQSGAVRRGIPTLGFQLVGKNQNHPNRIVGPITMLQALFDTMLSAHDERYIEKHNDYRTIKIPSDAVGLTEFSVSTERSMELFESGLSAGRRFLDHWSMDEYLKKYGQYERESLKDRDRVMS
ncbi:patatin [Paenibacillus swuensis]|uniref:Patatin n=1 Tax=Paenibacillus swuensis TaxID=1178515 RepID=A0A172TM31_9BACL|nr:patatin-like phospholipase family protein [Paenibacillus swuensis]ANE48090.1 patatin [Paenibacillus swuensis]